MTTITNLPKEIIAHILRYSDINIEDILSFSSTCKRFQEMIQDKWLWETKIYRRCPTVRRKFKTNKQQKFINKLNLREIETGITYTKKLRHFVSLISDNKLWITHKKELQNVLLLIAKNSVTYCFLWDELNKIINSEERQLDFNLTNKYNFTLILDCVKHYRFIYKIIEFMKMPREKQLLERLLTIVIQYIQPHVSYIVIDAWLNDIAQEVKARLLCIHPAHSIFMTSAENISFWRENNIDQNFCSPTEATQIMHILEKFIFSELDHKLHQLWISLCLEEHINYISEYFQRDILTFTYYCVARRLGIYCILKFIPGNGLVIAWKPEIDIKCLALKEILEGDLDKVQDAMFLFVKEESHLSYPSNIDRGTCNFGRLHLLSYFYISVIQKMIQPFYEKLRDHRPNIAKYKFRVLSNLLQTFTYNENIENIDVTIYENITNTIKIRSDDAVRNRLNRNNNNVRFAVGMIVTHSQYGISHDGVIIGWDCQNNREEFLQKLKSNLFFPYLCYNYNNHLLCSYTRVLGYVDQPHYIILAENNRICYVPQDHIFTCPPKSIDNIEIGRFFSRFEGTYYVANESLAYDYPDDVNTMFKIFPNYLMLS